MRLTAILTVGAALVACADERGPAVTVRDSAGITVVESHRPAWGDRSEWAVDSVAAVVIRAWSAPGGRDSFHLADAKVLPDGTIAVANGATGQIGFFDREGTLLRLSGGRGTEPGRFESLRGIHLFGDELWAFDTMGRWNVFDRRGGLLGSMYMEPHGASWSFAGPYGESGMAVLSGRLCCPTAPDASGFVRAEQPVLRYARSGRSLDTLTTLSGFETLVVRVGDRMSTSISRYGPRPVLHGGSERLYVGSGEAMEISAYGEGGRLERVIRIPDFDLALPEEVWTAEEERIGETVRRLLQDAGDVARAAVPDIPRRERRAAYSRFLEDALGNLWVGEHDPVTARMGLPASARWVVFDQEGRWLGSVDTPPGLRVTEIGADYLIGLDREGGRSVARLHRLRRR